MKLPIIKALAVSALFLSLSFSCTATDWQTFNHSPGYCATYGICGHRNDSSTDHLSCAINKEAEPLPSQVYSKFQQVCPQLAAEIGNGGAVCCTEEQLDILQQQIQQASIFLVGCPACNHNFKHFFCTLTCSPNQATFTNITAVQYATAASTRQPTTSLSFSTLSEDPEGFDNAVAEMDVYISKEFGEAFYNSCADVIFAPTNQRAMNFVGGGAQNYQEWVDFLGLVKDKQAAGKGSPFQINFPGFDEVPEEMEPLNGTMAGCGEGALACSCGDCPSAVNCEPPPPAPPPPPPGCPALHTPGPLTCLDLTFLGLFLAVLACIPAFIRFVRVQQLVEAQELGRSLVGGGNGRLGLTEPLLEDQQQLGGPETEIFGVPAEPSTSTAVPGAAVVPNSNDLQEERFDLVAGDEIIEYPASEELLRKGFRSLGYTCARRPWKTLGFCFVVILVAVLGVLRLQLVTEPAKLWVGSESQAAADKSTYESAFGPFYRISQLILSTVPSESSGNSASLSIINDANIRLLFEIQAQVDALTAGPNNTTLDSLCLKPLGDACATQSFIQYWQGSLDNYEGMTGPQLSPAFCIEHWNIACRAATGAPVDPKVVLGGFPRQGNVSFVRDSTAFIITYPLSSKKESLRDAEAWEAAFLGLAAGTLAELARKANLSLSFSTERSVEDELKRESNADAGTVVWSYLLMLLYVAFALGKIPPRASWRTALIHGRVLLALGGVLIVAAAVAGALGLCGWLSIGATLIIMEVIPFLALAIGVDNVFILTQAAEKVPEGTSPAGRAAAALATAGPSMLLAATSETLGFAVGTLTSMPALRDFAACAAFAIALDFFLQITAFPALLALDFQRIDQRRYDVLPFIQAPAPWTEEDEEEATLTATGGLTNATEEEDEDEKQPWQLVLSSHHQEDVEQGWGVSPSLRWYMKNIHAPLLRFPMVKGVVLAVFAGATLWSCAMLPRLEKGLDQRVALPQDSYLQGYFSDVAELLRVGPPVFFVAQNLSLSSDVDKICSVASCQSDSLLNRVSQAAREPWESWMATPASSWLDDFISWSSPELPQCCRVFPSNGTACKPPDQWPCFDPNIPDLDQSTHLCDECVGCFTSEDLPAGALPTAEQFIDKLPQFLEAQPSAQCAKGGAGPYSNSFQREFNGSSGIKGLSEGTIAASSFMAYYLPLSSQGDFIAALQATRDLIASASSALGLNLYSYSIFHIFFEQYLTLGGEALTMLGSAAVAIFVLCLLATGSPWAAAVVLITLTMLCVDLAGVMALTGIQANAVSLVNLAAAVGIGVEFCVHIMHAFMEAEGTKEERMATALEQVGAAVLSGITATKLVGVAVLASAHTMIFRVYFFKFYLALVVLGALHGLVFLPVVLSALGPEAFHHWKLKWQHR